MITNSVIRKIIHIISPDGNMKIEAQGNHMSHFIVTAPFLTAAVLTTW